MYLTLADVKLHLGIVGTADDAYLTALIVAAQTTLETVYGRHYEAVVEAREFGPDALQEARLRLDADLLSVTTLTNGDGTIIPAIGFRLWPYNTKPATGIKLRSGYTWTFTSDGLISVAGLWGTTVTPPANVVQAMRELVSDLFHVEDRRTSGLAKGAAAYQNVDQLPRRVQQLMGAPRVSL